MASELKPLTKLQMLEIMIVETKNQITKSKVMESVAFRQSLEGGTDRNEKLMGMKQAEIKSFEGALRHLEALHKEELDKAPKEVQS